MGVLGFLGALLYGAAYSGSWAYDDTKERERRMNAQKNNRSFYHDKRGIMRHASNGKKFTTEEVHQLFYGQREEEDRQRELRKKERERRSEKKYYSVDNPYELFHIEVFLTYEEAKEYIKKCKEDNKDVKDEPDLISEAYYSAKGSLLKFNLHF